MKYWKAFVLFLCIMLVTFPSQVKASGDSDTITVGLYYGNGALATANLENSVGSGYRFGYYTGPYRFVELGRTAETQLSMLKTQTIYLKDNTYYTSNPGGNVSVIGCYHIQLSGSYQSYEDALSVAQQYDGGFPAWISGSYVVRVGAYETKSIATEAESTLGEIGRAYV